MNIYADCRFIKASCYYQICSFSANSVKFNKFINCFRNFSIQFFNNFFRQFNYLFCFICIKSYRIDCFFKVFTSHFAKSSGVLPIFNILSVAGYVVLSFVLRLSIHEISTRYGSLNVSIKCTKSLCCCFASFKKCYNFIYIEFSHSIILQHLFRF